MAQIDGGEPEPKDERYVYQPDGAEYSINTPELPRKEKRDRRNADVQAWKCPARNDGEAVPGALQPVEDIGTVKDVRIRVEFGYKIARRRCRPGNITYETHKERECYGQGHLPELGTPVFMRKKEHKNEREDEIEGIAKGHDVGKYGRIDLLCPDGWFNAKNSDVPVVKDPGKVVFIEKFAQVVKVFVDERDQEEGKPVAKDVMRKLSLLRPEPGKDRVIDNKGQGDADRQTQGRLKEPYVTAGKDYGNKEDEGHNDRKHEVRARKGYKGKDSFK